MAIGNDPTSHLLGALMDAAGERYRVLAANVANQNTPGYTRQVLSFEEKLREALDKGRSVAQLVKLDPTVEADHVTPARADGNNVSLELELSSVRQNRLLYEMYSAIYTSRFDLLRTAIESGR